MLNPSEVTRALVKDILEQDLERARQAKGRAAVARWSVQGFGMVRRYFGRVEDSMGPKGGDDWRLNVWDKRFAVPNVSVMHDHPWDFESVVVAGRFANTRYTENADAGICEGCRIPSNCFHEGGCRDGKPHRFYKPEAMLFSWAWLQPGVGGGLKLGTGGEARLGKLKTEEYRAGDVYQQHKREVHVSEYRDGTVTFNRRFNRRAADQYGRGGDEARVYWPRGTEWVSAIPRPATAEDLVAALELALLRWED